MLEPSTIFEGEYSDNLDYDGVLLKIEVSLILAVILLYFNDIPFIDLLESAPPPFIIYLLVTI
jgi:hypothetical protein